MSKEERKGWELEEKRGRIPHGLVSRTLPCCCSGDGFLQCSGHIITFTHFCLVSRSTEASPSWDRQQKSCRESSLGSGLRPTFEENTLIKFVNKRQRETRLLVYTHNINTIFYVQ